MDYYKRRELIKSEIDKAIKGAKNAEQAISKRNLYLELLTHYGCTEKMLDRTLAYLEENKIIKLEDGLIIPL